MILVKLFLILPFLRPISLQTLTWNVTNVNRLVPNIERDQWITIWPHKPLEEFRHHDADISMQLVPFEFHRVKDYDAMREKGMLALSISMMDLYRKRDCSRPVDTVQFLYYHRYIVFSGIERTMFDNYCNASFTGFSPLPFGRHIDAVFEDPRTGFLTYFINDWFYTFSIYDRFIRQGRLRYYWDDYYKTYVDAVFVHKNKTTCRIYNDSIDCSSSNIKTTPLNEFFKPLIPPIPIKAAISNRGEIGLLDGRDYFWFYDEHNLTLKRDPIHACEIHPWKSVFCCDDDENKLLFDDGSGDGENLCSIELKKALLSEAQDEIIAKL